MNRYTQLAIGCIFGVGLASNGFAGQATTNATAANGWGRDGSAAAQAQYDGDGGLGFARTRTRAGDLPFARGVAVGFDREGLDVSFSHALAPKLGPAYAGTFNLSIGLDGQTSGSYGGVIAQGGLSRSVEAGGATTSRPGGGAQAVASGETGPGGEVHAVTRSYQRPVQRHVVARGRPVVQPRPEPRFGRSYGRRLYR